MSDHAKAILEVLLPSSVKEGILLVWDTLGITMWYMFGKETLHSLNEGAEFLIKALTIAGLAVTLIIKVGTLKKQRKDGHK